jgi:hypothetical protein
MAQILAWVEWMISGWRMTARGRRSTDVCVAATRPPTGRWIAQQLRNITPFGEGPDVIIRDRDSKLGAESIAWLGALASKSSGRRCGLL